MISRKSHAIYLFHTRSDTASTLTAAHNSGRIVLDLRVSDLTDDDEFALRMIEVFQIPYPSVGVDAALDFAAGIDEWLPCPTGYLLMVTGLDECPPNIAQLTALIVTILVDRYRSGTEPFDVVVVTDARYSDIVRMVREQNDKLDEFGKTQSANPTTCAVPVYTNGMLDRR